MRTGWWLAVACMAMTALGCATKTSDKDLQFVGPDEGEALIQSRRRLLGLAGETSGAWIDPRTRAEFDAGHIPGALHVPFERVRTEYKSLQAFNVLVVYGNTYNSPVANSASKTLIELGVKNVHTLQGGLDAWKAAGNEIETNVPTE